MSSVVRNQAKLVGIALAAGLAWTAFGPGTALAASLAERQCTTFCGDAGVASFSGPGGEPSCVCNEQTKDVNGKALGTATQESETGKGNFNDKSTGQGDFPQTDCTGNQGQCKK